MTAPDLNQLLAHIHPEKLARLSARTNLPALLEAASNLSDAQLQRLARTLTPERPAPALPSEHSDFFDLNSTFPPDIREVQAQVRAFMEREVAPIMNDHWSRDVFPRHLIPRFRDLNLGRLVWNDDGSRTRHASLIEGLITQEMCRVDVSTAVFYGVHAGLAFTSLALGGSDAQKQEWLPRMLDFTAIGAFGLTEPEGGSQVSRGMRTTCRRDGDAWVLNGVKKWIGNSTFSDFTVIWARDEDTSEVRGFIVRAGTPGYHVEKMLGKTALRMVENGLITLQDARVPDADRLGNTHGWRTTADVLKRTRGGVAWQGIGCALGAYELAVHYAQTREQFGKRIGEFQLVQNLLVRMLGNVTAMQTLGVRLAQLADAGTMTDEQASLAKQYTAARCRETVALAREAFGGNGILLENGVAKHFADAEAIYSYEGTNEINTLVVGRAITGLSAFL